MTASSSVPARATPVLQRGEGLAAWKQIADGIEADIAAGRLKPGEKLASETELAVHFGVNRHTVRRALSGLASRGLVRATQGRGTFVEDKPVLYPIGPKTRFSEVMSKVGREAWGDLIESRVIAAGDATAAALAIAPGDEVLELVTLHRADGAPISTARTCLPLPRFERLDQTYRRLGSLTKAYARHGVADYTRLATRIGARLAAPDEAALLELTPGRVVLVIDSINIDLERRPIQATTSHFAADRVELVIES
jgi:GntR family transcriptional regulator, phosphonate transport system regulatory protein